MSRSLPLLAGAVLALAATAAPAAAAPDTVSNTAPAAAPTAPPVARVAPVTDTYFGEKVTDRYRWMENGADPDWLPFMKSQAAYARSVLDRLPLRAELLARVHQVAADVTAPGELQRAGNRLFYTQRPAGGNNFKLYVLDHGKSRLLVDPTVSDTATSHTSLDWWRASPDGSRLVYGLSKDGSEDSTLQVMEVDTGTVLPERIGFTEHARPSWLDDGSGFFYNQLTGKVGTPERYLDARARFHRLGTDPASDPVLMARGQDPAVKYDNIQAPYIVAGSRSRYAVLTLSDVRSESRILVAPVADVVRGKANWKPVADFADEVTDFSLVGDDLVLLANRDHPRGRVLQTRASAPSLARARELVPESKLVIQGVAHARDGLYLQAMDGGVSRLERVGADGKAAMIALPFESTLSQLATDPTMPGATMQLSGWLTPAAVWAVDAAGAVRDTGLTPAPAIDVSQYVTERRFAAARDGVKVPYTILYKKGMKKDGANPAYVSAYGSYGASAYTPRFAGRLLALVDQGAVVGFANVRGGGEYGRDWHRAGQLENKPNTWRDLIAVCEDLDANRYTAPARTAIFGGSAGGITVGRALTERPDLFAAVVSGVGWHNPLRYVVEQEGFTEEPEWGAIADPAGYRALKLIDSYQAVVDGTHYPAVLLTTGITDPRVAPFHPAKMAARLQAASASGKPVLLRVTFDAGHGIGSTRTQQDLEAVDTYAFVLAQTRGK